MSVPQDRLDGGGSTAGDERDLSKCLLGLFNHISLERFHKLAFIAEYQYYKKNGVRLTDANYVPTLDGIYSEEMQEALDKLDNLERATVKIQGENIETVKVLTEFDCELDGERLIKNVAMEYGEESPKEVNEVLRSYDIYAETAVGDVIEFNNAESRSQRQKA